MKVFLLGATGRLGQEILKKLMRESIQTSVLIRDARKLTFNSEHLSVFEGDPANFSDLEAAVQGCDTVITTLNISRKSDFPWSKLRAPKTLLSDTMTNLLALSSNHEIGKIITLSAWGVHDSKKELPFWFRWIIDNSNIKYGYLDHERQEDLLVQSDIDWMIVRPVGLTNSQKDKAAKVWLDAKLSGMMVSRRAVAHFIVENLESAQFRRKIVTLS